MRNTLLASLLIVGSLLGGIPSAHATEPDDVIARVGDEVITFRELDIIINSSGVIGIPIPEPGTRARTNMRLNLLDRAITVNLLYLDALARGLDKNPVFQSDLEHRTDSLLASMYRQKYLIGDIPVSDEEIRAFYQKNYTSETPFTQDLHMAIESLIRKERYQESLATLRERLRQGVEVTVFEEQIDPAGDGGRKSSEVVASIDGEPVVWGEVRQLLAPSVESTADNSRRERLDGFIDTRIMTNKARAAGMLQDLAVQQRLNEFRKTRLVKLRRAQLSEAEIPTEAELRDFYTQNRDRIAIPETRNVQMIVVQTQEEASEIKNRVESGEMTFYEAAAEYSIHPNAKMDLGELGWVAKGSGFPELDKVTFALKVDEISGPVESPAGWHLVRALDIRPGQFEDIDEPATLKKTKRMLMHENEDRYVTALRKNDFKVEVYDEVFSRLTQQEVDEYAGKQKTAAANDGGN